ncbi:hypothetical protein AB4033_000127 [Listeria monocytogenes]|nr:hypothetical protein [Listeria monocytogenes]EGA6436933.1 hypothetical protein [Listeria monocytogenes]EJU1318118.1 hypothetical protein [Listeria monocytogenes]
MKLTNDFIERNMRQFHRYALRTLHYAALTAYYERLRLGKNTITFSSLSFQETRLLYRIDQHFTDDTIFNVLDYEIIVQDNNLANALNCLPEQGRNIILLKYFLGWTDRKIGEVFSSYDSSTRKRRLAALRVLRIIYEEQNGE